MTTSPSEPRDDARLGVAQPQNLGDRLRRARFDRGLIAADVAARAGISPSFLSQVERGNATPSLKVLGSLAAALDVSLGALLETGKSYGESAEGAGPTPAVSIVRHNARKVLRRATGPDYQLLSPDLTGQIQFIWVELDPGEHSVTDASHEGEEQIVVLEGELSMRVGDDEYVLRAGDSIRFDSIVPHSSANGTDRRVVFLSAGTPPSF